MLPTGTVYTSLAVLLHQLQTTTQLAGRETEAQEHRSLGLEPETGERTPPKTTLRKRLGAS